jgi:hypothetical protein
MLILVRHLPGAGSSTFASNIQAVYSQAGISLKVHSADDYFYENGQIYMEYEFDASKLYLAHMECLCRTRADLILKKDVIVTNTFTTEKELSPYLELAKELDVQLISLILENRHGNSSIHNVSEETIEKMESRFVIKLR